MIAQILPSHKRGGGLFFSHPSKSDILFLLPASRFLFRNFIDITAVAALLNLIILPSLSPIIASFENIIKKSTFRFLTESINYFLN